MPSHLTKFQSLRFSQQRVPLPAECRLSIMFIPQTTEVKYSGVIFSSDLTWNRYMEAVPFKAASTLKFIRRNFTNAPQDVKEPLYLSNIRPIPEYACVVWDPHSQNLIDRLEPVQNRAAQFVAQNYRFPISNTLIKDPLVWPNLSLRRKRFCICFLRDVNLKRTAVARDLYLQPLTYVSNRRDQQFKIK